MSNWPRVVASLAFLSPPLGWRAALRYRRLSGLRPAQVHTLPSLSIIVPARNEADNLRRLLPSLRELAYDGSLDVIVVDDNSTDDTAAVARGFGVRVLSLEDLPPNWCGKPYACHMGAEAANGEWFLFTDADTIHAPNGPAQAVSYALDQGLDGLSTFLRQEYRGLLDRLAIQAAFAGLFASLSGRQAPLNGQYILLRRDVYTASGGFAAVRSEPVEDLALGRHLQRSGYQVPLLRGDHLAEVAMYRDRAQVWRGMARIGAGALRWSGANSLISTLFITALMTPLLVLAMSAARLINPTWLLASWGSVMIGLWPWNRDYGDRRQLILAPAGALFVQMAALWGLISRLTGRGLRWKGRVV